MPLRIDFDPKEDASRSALARRFSEAFKKQLNLTLPPSLFYGQKYTRIISLSQVVERHLEGKPFSIEVEPGARVNLENLAHILQIEGLTSRVEKISIRKAESDNTDLVPMRPPQIKGRVMRLKDVDLFRPAASVRKAVIEALRSGAGRFAEGISPRSEELRHVLLGKMGIELDERDQALLEKIDFLNVDPRDPRQDYHVQILKSLFSPVQEDGLPHVEKKQIYDIMEKTGLSAEEIERIVIEGSVLVDDISLELGTRRDVDRITVITAKGEKKSFTASIDKEPAEREALTHSQEEFETLLDIQKETDVVQRLYGLHVEEDENLPGFHRAVIFKEYLEGVATGLLYDNLTEEQKGLVTGKTGEMLGRFYDETDSFPADMNNLNVIVNETEEDVSCRICDLSDVEMNPDRIARHTLPAIANDYPGHANELLGGFMDKGGHKAANILRKLANTPILGAPARRILRQRQMKFVLPFKVKLR